MATTVFCHARLHQLERFTGELKSSIRRVHVVSGHTPSALETRRGTNLDSRLYSVPGRDMLTMHPPIPPPPPPLPPFEIPSFYSGSAWIVFTIAAVRAEKAPLYASGMLQALYTTSIPAVIMAGGSGRAFFRMRCIDEFEHFERPPVPIVVQGFLDKDVPLQQPVCSFELVNSDRETEGLLYLHG